jgi:alkane 1-monooxygenase
MTSATAVAGDHPLALREVASIWVRHLLSLYIPLNSLLFLWTGPHRWYVAVLFMAPLVAAHQIDCLPRAERRQPARSLPAWPFDALVYLLAAIQIWVVVELVRLFAAQQGIFSFDMLMVFLIVGGSSGFSIITAHELIHRNKRWEQTLGRLLLCTVLYEHFFTEHLRGHHVRVGTPEDPATARFGEAYEPFFRRTVPAQLRSAWRLETRRLGDAGMRLLDRRQLGNRVLHGLVFEWGIAVGILAAFGLAAFVAFVAQAFMAVRLLEAVNYFEHWGLRRRGRRVRPVDSWDTHSWFTYYGLIGLSRHADHHAAPTRPYQQLRVFDEAPLLPFGYVGMVDLVMGRNEDFQSLAAEELERRRLGPFAAPAEPVPEGEPAPPADATAALEDAQGRERAAASARGGAARRLGRAWLSLPLLARRVLVLSTVVLVTALGASWETGGTGLGLPGRVLLHGWILAVFSLLLPGRHWLAERGVSENATWVLFFASLLLTGLGTDTLV